jgi:competence protein ComEA
MKDFLAPYFFYSRSERNGVFILAAFSLAILMLPKLYTAFPKPPEATDFTAFEKALAAFDRSKTADTEGGVFEKETDYNNALFGFNPNTASLDKLTQLGLSSRTATTLIHYRERGGQFRRPEDLRKVYGLTAADYDRLKDYIELDNATNWNRKEPLYWEKYGDKTGFRKEASFGEKPQIAVNLKPFDPNTATEMDLLELGLEEKTVNNMLKYRQNGGVFRKKEDLKKLYNFSDIDFIRIEKFVQIADNQAVVKSHSLMTQNGTPRKGIENQLIITIDVNKATHDDWLQLRGIGATFAARIITQREKIGGFATIEQLKEVYGLPDSTLQNIAPYLKLTTPVYRKLHVNKATPDALTHPYLTRKQAESLVRYRLNHGEFKNIYDIKKTGVFSDSNLELLRPYISLD